MDKILQVKNLNKTFTSNSFSLFSAPKAVVAANNITFDINRGESFGLVGESGSGKSTIANIIARLLPPDSGQILFNGQNIFKSKGKEARNYYRNLQMVFQDPYATLNPRKTIGWSIGEALRNFGDISREEVKQRVVEALTDVGLNSSYYDRYPHNLSGGQRQRVAIASTIILRPELILIDEGVSALDVSIQAAILNLLNDLKKKYKLTYLFISHDLNVIEYFCDRVAVMYRGDLIEVFDPSVTSVEDRSDYTRKLFDSIPQIYL
ncbi:Glutathione import ATP-binding protein GsiA [Alloiococcus otitis]|uniref:ABC transporter domain-containing protein n=1 Tax=Alloiococcus otitis ATCC 51267 TaxID=883081 RepID=K9EBU8_9LACT|nr:ATP-binding cassette domain-containing protein [Alloiococcus otitis]EKU94168.1 hypothetical protein HMPREF9698_00200 [Alloiococcus otitis ATCC 51267]SUU81199.1 Glutathione import ATP-binding protein GsiA [Alloiococcus otitis]